MLSSFKLYIFIALIALNLAEPITDLKVCLKDLDCSLLKCRTGYQCGLMTSDTHCETAICVPEDLASVVADPDKCPIDCQGGEECGRVKFSKLDMRWIRSICVSKDENKLLKAFQPVCPAVVIDCENNVCDSGFQCRIMTSDTHYCGTLMCVPENPRKCENCVDGEECGQIRTSEHTIDFQEICVPKDASKLVGPTGPGYGATPSATTIIDTTSVYTTITDTAGVYNSAGIKLIPAFLELTIVLLHAIIA